MPKQICINNKISPYNKIIQVSSDKSLSIRWVLLSSLASGVSRAKNLLISEDVLATLKAIKRLGIKDHIASIRSIDVNPDNQSLLAGKEEEIFPLLLDAARSAVEGDGADVIILGSTTMHQSHSFLKKNLNVPVINPGPLTYKMAETMIGAGLCHSKTTYPESTIPKLHLFEAMMAAAKKADD